jgi:adenylate cyclase class 2
MHEIEMKAPVKSAGIYRKKLGKPVEKQFFVDTVFDRGDELESSDRFVRIRRYKDKAVLTYKGPREESVAKKRVETEVEIDDAESMEKIFESLGFAKVQTNERKREVYRFMGGEVVIDELPKLGFFIEIETDTVENIFRIAEELGIPKDDLTKKTYFELMDEYMDRTGERFNDLGFS